MAYNYFETEGNSIKARMPMQIYLENSNYEILPTGDLDAFLFGAIVIANNNGKTETHTITLGTKVTIPIYSKEQLITDDVADHTIVKFQKDDVVIKNRFVIKTIDNVAAMFDTLMSGHLSKLIPYYMYYDIVMNNMELNETLGFPKILLEMMLGEMFIDEHGRKARRTGLELAIPASTADLVQTAGAFNSMTFDDPDKSILINKGKTDTQQELPSKLETYFRK